jgi:hypothetical protein
MKRIFSNYERIIFWVYLAAVVVIALDFLKWRP